jgi:hypothetical protein
VQRESLAEKIRDQVTRSRPITPRQAEAVARILSSGMPGKEELAPVRRLYVI